MGRYNHNRVYLIFFQDLRGEVMAFEISDDTPKDKREILAKKKERVIRRQQEREEELRRKKFDFEEQKRIQEREKMIKEEALNDLKKLENERRDAILKNHKAGKTSTNTSKKLKESSRVINYNKL